MPNITYTVLTDMNPQELTLASLAIYERWIAFAMGKEQLQGFKLHHPTGRYASSISRRQFGPFRIAIIANEKQAPEGAFLEEGHGPVDLKKKLVGGKLYKMHRGDPGSYGSKGYGSPILSNSRGDRRKNVWAEPKAEGSSGFARVPTKITAENAQSWIIPRMVAYSPAQNLVDLFRRGAFNQ